jgi:5-methylcytosine-specific restriction endonuclease McrA
MPCNYKNYHPAWKQISLSIIRDRAKDCCELCGKENGMYILYPKGLLPHAWHYCTKQDRGILNGRVIKVVLTVHHIDYEITNNKSYNLIALCQRCHNKLDMPLRIRNRKKRKCNDT